MADDDLQFVEEYDTGVSPDESALFSDSVLYSSDWTVQTIISQLINKNIDIIPRF
jgi:hypothetical protein